MIEEKIKNLIRNSLQKIGIDVVEVSLEHPDDVSHGDFSTNVSLVHAKTLGRKPREVAEEIVRYIVRSKPPEIEKVEVAGAGFINFLLSREFFTKSVAEIAATGRDFGKNTYLVGKKMMVEYTNTNLFKELHIGHMMSNNIGESLARILEAHGAEVKRDTYQSDVGLNVAKAIWGAQRKNHPTRTPSFGAGGESRIKNQEWGAKEWGEAYALGTLAYETDEAAKKEIVGLNKAIFDKSDASVNELYEKGREASLAHFEALYKKLDTKFDYYFFESEVATRGMKLVSEGLERGVFEKSDGAVVFKGEPYGLHTRVFISSAGLPTYEGKELGLAFVKYEKYRFDTAIIITANEQNDYFKVVLRALARLDEALAERTKHLSHGLLRLPSGKMGSRKGNVITGESLIEAVEAMVHKKLEERELETFEKNKIAETVAIGAIKYSILRQAIGSDIIFDLEKSISFEGDSGPYLQYSYVRANSVLAKAASEKIGATVKEVPKEISLLERLLPRFPEVVARAGAEYAPHFIATYLIELAGAFNSYYATNQIVSEGDPTSPYKVALTKAFATVMKRGLFLLGIKVPEKM